MFRELNPLVVALAIGDGCISKQGFLTIKHSATFTDYMMWKSGLLTGAGIQCRVGIKDNSGFPGIALQTRSIFKNERALLYPDDKKQVPLELIREVVSNPLYLAIWYMDDGSLVKKRGKSGRYKSREAYLSTESFSEQDNRTIATMFQEVLSISAKVHAGKGKHHLWMNTANATKLVAYIGEYVMQIPSMVYKVDFCYPLGKPNPIELPLDRHGVNSRTKAGHATFEIARRYSPSCRDGKPTEVVDKEPLR